RHRPGRRHRRRGRCRGAAGRRLPLWSGTRGRGQYRVGLAGHSVVPARGPIDPASRARPPAMTRRPVDSRRLVLLALLALAPRGAVALAPRGGEGGQGGPGGSVPLGPLELTARGFFRAPLRFAWRCRMPDSAGGCPDPTGEAASGPKYNLHTPWLIDDDY